MRNTPAVTLVAVLLLSAGGVLAQENSGFLGDAYGKLQKTTSPSGDDVKRWISPALAKYDKVLLEKTILYPEPKGTGQVSDASMRLISGYLDEALRREIGAVMQVVDQPGPGTLRLKPAITAAVSKDQGVQPHEALPLALIVAQAKKAAGKRAKEAVLAIEWEARDAKTGELLGAGMREGRGQNPNAATDRVTLDSYKTVLDTWAKDTRAALETTRSR